jgi:hypothetical protein
MVEVDVWDAVSRRIIASGNRDVAIHVNGGLEVGLLELDVSCRRPYRYALRLDDTHAGQLILGCPAHTWHALHALLQVMHCTHAQRPRPQHTFNWCFCMLVCMRQQRAND